MDYEDEPDVTTISVQLINDRIDEDSLTLPMIELQLALAGAIENRADNVFHELLAIWDKKNTLGNGYGYTAGYAYKGIEGSGIDALVVFKYTGPYSQDTIKFPVSYLYEVNFKSLEELRVAEDHRQQKEKADREAVEAAIKAAAQKRHDYEVRRAQYEKLKKEFEHV